MRHSDIGLTMITYTDPKLLDVQGALNALPSLPLTDVPHSQREVARATGTDNLRPSTVIRSVTPTVTPTADFSSQKQTSPDASSALAIVTGSKLCRAAPPHNFKRKSLVRTVCEQGFSSRDDRRCTFPNDLTGIRLFHSAISQVVEFTADEFYSLAAATE